MTEYPKDLLQALDCVFHGPHATYLSGPITTGLRFMEWHSQTGKDILCSKTYKTQHESEVINPNIKSLKKEAVRLRSAGRPHLIEPGSLKIPHWSQTDYMNFWLQVMERFGKEAIMHDGWEYSYGCVKEYNHARKLGFDVFDLAGERIKPVKGEKMVQYALEKLEKEGIPYHRDIHKLALEL